MLKKWFCFTIMAMVAVPAFAQYDDLKTASGEQIWLRFVLEHTEEWRASLVEPTPDVARNLHARLTALAASTSRLASANAPEVLKSDVQSAVQGMQFVTRPSAKTMSDLSYMAVGGDKTVPRVKPAFDEARKRLTGIDDMVKAFFGQTSALKNRLTEVDRLLGELSPAERDCVLQRIDQVSRTLAPLVRERNQAVQRLSTALNNSLVDSPLNGLTRSYQGLAQINTALEPLATGLARTESMLTGKIDLSFRYWSTTPEGRFGEVTVPVQIESAVLFGGSAAAKEKVGGLLPSPLQKFAQAYGLDWALEAVDQDLPEVVRQLKSDLDVLSKARADQLDDLSQLTDTSLIGSVAGFGEGMDKYLRRPDASAPNYGVLEASSSFDYRDIDKHIEALSAANLRSACK